MRTRTTRAAAALLAAGALLGWLAASGRLITDVHAQDKALADKTPYKFERGFPTPETAERVHEEEDYERAVQAYQFWFIRLKRTWPGGFPRS